MLTFLCILAIASCVPVFPSYNTASSAAQKATSGELYNQNLFTRDDSRIRHVSTTVLKNAGSSTDFATALSQPVALEQVLEPVAVTDPIVSVVEPVYPYHNIPIIEPVLPILEPTVQLVEPVVPLAESVAPYFGTPLLEPLIPNGNVVPYYNNPLVPLVEPAARYQNPYYVINLNFPYYGVNPNLPYYGVNPIFPYYGTPAV